MRPLIILLALATAVGSASAMTWAELRSLSLAQAESLWQAANPELRLAKSAVAMAEADRLAADRGNNPQFSWAGTSINPRSGIGAGPVQDKAIDQVLHVEQLIERGGKRELRKRAAEAWTGAAWRDAEDVARQGRIQLHFAYWDLHQAEERERVSASAAELAKTALAAAERRVKAGDLAPADLARLSVDALRAENDARTALADRQKGQVSLAYLIGLPAEEANLKTSDNWPALAALPSLEGPDIEQRADVRAATARVAAAEAVLEGARALNRRDITLGIQYERYPPAGGSAPNNTWGLSVSVPLFFAHAYEGEIARAEADLEAAHEQLARVRALASGESAQTRANLAAASERRHRLDAELLPAAQTVASAAEFAYFKGASSLLELIDARRTLRQIQQDAAAARADYAKALAAWRFQTYFAIEVR